MFSRASAVLLVALSFAAWGSPGSAENPAASFDGFVTRIVSPTEFDVGSRHVLCDSETKWKQPKNVPDYLAKLRVGMLVHVHGQTRKGAFFAKELEASPMQAKSEAVVTGKGLIQLAPELHADASGQGVAGTLWIEGYRVEVVPATKLLDAAGNDLPADKITTNMWANYEATRGGNGPLVALKVSFEPNKVDADEGDFRKKSEPELVPADPVRHKAAQLRSGDRVPVKFDLVADQSVQDYVSRVGNSLVPQYQKDLPASDPTKINFRFYVVKIPSGWMRNMEDATDLPCGVVLVTVDALGRWKMRLS